MLHNEHDKVQFLLDVENGAVVAILEQKQMQR